MRKPVAFSVALGLFALTNIAVASMSHLYQPQIEKVAFKWTEEDSRVRPWSWWLARKWLEQKKAPDVVLFGSSQMGSAMVASDAKQLSEAIDSLTHRRAATFESELEKQFGQPVTAFSLASPGAMCSDAFMASSALFREGMKPKLVVISIAPRDFIDNTMPYPAATEPYKFYSQFVDPGDLTKVAYDGGFAWLQHGMESMPCRKFGAYVQASMTSGSDPSDKPETKAKTALAAIMGGGEAVPGKWLVPSVIPPMWSDNSKEYKLRFRNPHPPVYKAEKAFFEQFLSKMREENIAVLVVGMPSMAMNRALLPNDFWQEFRTQVSTTAQKHGAMWLDLTDSTAFAKSDFLDTVHLNAEGGEKLFAILARGIQNQPALCRALTGSPVQTAGRSDSVPQ